MLEKMARKKELRGFEGKLKVFLQGLQCFKAQIRLCFKGMHSETTECADMRTGHSGSSLLLLLSPLGAWSDSQQCLEPQLWSQTESLGGRDRTKLVQGSPRDRNYSCCFELMQNQHAGTPLGLSHRCLLSGLVFELWEEVKGSISGTTSSEWE